MKVVTCSEMADIDRRAQTEFGLSEYELMDAAGCAVASVILKRFRPPRACVVCGKGNNAGDGYVVARELHRAKVDVRTVAVAPPSGLRGAAARAFEEAGRAGVPMAPPEELEECLVQADVVVDALLGTGARGPMRPEWAPIVEAMNRAPGIVVAVDVPSGVREMQPNEELGPIVRADITVTIGCPKLPLLVLPTSVYTGELITERINFPPQLLDASSLMLNYEDPAVLGSWLPARPQMAHKGTFGKVGIIAGSPPYAGAAVLATRAALRAGCGLAYLFTTATLNPVYKIAIPEAVTVIITGSEDGSLDEASLSGILEGGKDLDAAVIGPGLGAAPAQRRLVRTLIDTLSIPLVLDADALNVLAGDLPRLRESIVLTPHPGEMARLLGMTTAEVQSQRLVCARELAQGCGATVVLKGADTVVARPDGQVWLSPGGTSALAKGGTGDVLAGLIGSLLAQRMIPWQAALLGAQVHLRAGVHCARVIGERGVLAGEVADAIPHAMNELETCTATWTRSAL